MKRWALLVAWIFLTAGASRAAKPVAGTLCVAGKECREYICGQDLAPEAADTPYTLTTRSGEVFVGIRGSGERTISCARGGELEMRINARKLHPRSDVRIVISDEKERSWTVRFSAPRLAAPIVFNVQRGTWKVLVDAPHFASFRTSVAVADARATLAVDLKPLPLLSGTVIDRGTGRGVGGVLISTDVETETVSDAEGRFALEADPDKWPKTISLNAGGYADTTVDVPPARVNASFDQIYLSRGGTVVVELQQDTPGDAIEIELQRLRNDGRSLGGTVRKLAVPKAEASTVLTLERIEPGDYVVLVKGDKEWERLGEPVAVQAGETVRLPLRISPFPLRVRTIREGEPFPKAYVEVQSRDVHWKAVVVTGEDGEAAVELWQGGRMNSTVHAPGIVAFRERRTIEDGEEAEWIINLPTREITGRVVDAQTGAPIGGAGVNLSMRSDERYHMTVRVTAAADGTFRLAGPAYGQHVLKAAAVGYAPAEVKYSFLEPEQSRSIVIRLDTASPVTLTVRDSRGVPVSGARVLDFRGLERVGISVTDPSGIARLTLPEDEIRDVFVVPRDGSLGFLQVRGGTKEASLRIGEGVSRLVVRMESESRQPIPNLSIVVRYNGRLLPLEVLDELGKSQGARVWSDADGRIVFGHMPLGLYEFWPVASKAELRALSAGTGRAPSVRIAATPGENVAVMTFAEQKKP